MSQVKEKKPKSKTKKKCLICGYTRAVDRAHIIPKSILRDIKQFKEYVGFDNENIIILCKNHHFLFDKGELTNKEWQKIKQEAVKIDHLFDLLLNSEIKTNPEYSKKPITYWLEKKHRKIKLWADRFAHKFGYYELSLYE